MLLLFQLLFFMDSVSAETETVMEGDSVTLHTSLSEILNDDTILWLFGPKDSFISQITRKEDLNSIYFTDDERFRHRLQVDQNTGSLIVRNTRIRHSGQYKLSISREKIFNVTVSGVVNNKTNEVKSISVKEGESVTLNIYTDIRPDDLILWRFGDQGILLAKIDVKTEETSLNDDDERFIDRLKIDHQTGSLIITNTRTEHSGLYELQIRGRESSQRFLLSVTAVPDPGLSSGAIAGIFFGVLVSVLIVAACIYNRWRISKPTKQMVSEGKSATLPTDLTEIQGTDTIKWCYGAKNNLIAEINGGTERTLPGADGRFISKLMMNARTGDLTINNIRTIHSGLYMLKISGNRRTIDKSFIVNVNVRTLEVKEGLNVHLETGHEIQDGDLMLWTFGPENRLVVHKKELEMTISESFKDRLELDDQTGSLRITNITRTDSGHFKLQILNTRQATFRRFNVKVLKIPENESETDALVEVEQDDTTSV